VEAAIRHHLDQHLLGMAADRQEPLSSNRYLTWSRRICRHSVLLLAIAAALVIAITAAIVLKKRLQSRRPVVKADAI
jgi:hypothetical protein